MAEELLTIAQAAERLKVHHQTIRRFIRSRQLNAARIGGQYRIPESELQRVSAIQTTAENDERLDAEPLSPEDLNEIRAGLAQIQNGETVPRKKYRESRPAAAAPKRRAS